NYSVPDVSTEEISDDEINELIDMELENNVEIRKIKRNKVKNGDYIYIDYSMYFNEVLIEQRENETILVGNNNFCEEIEKKLVGLKVGKKKIIDIIAAEDFFEASLVGKKIKCIITVNSINQYIKPELTNSFVKNIYKEKELKNVEQFYEWIRQRCLQNKESELLIKTKNKIRKKLIKESKFQMNEQEIANYSFDIYKKYEEIAYAYGYDDIKDYYKNELNLSEDGFFDMCCDEGENEIKECLVIAAISQKENIHIFDTDIKKYCEENDEPYTEALSSVEKNKYIYAILKDKIYDLFIG
ncbi:MAG: hypothetical protein K2N51_14280, partial [Lachnospiraceae bacterium]|nr:hypothetical protein [Lachnospiraceae bacterium]